MWGAKAVPQEPDKFLSCSHGPSHAGSWIFSVCQDSNDDGKTVATLTLKFFTRLPKSLQGYYAPSLCAGSRSRPPVPSYPPPGSPSFHIKVPKPSNPETKLSETTFAEATVAEAEIAKAEYTNAKFANAQFYKATFAKATLVNTKNSSALQTLRTAKAKKFKS